jgi:hypothetical protein
MNIFIFHVTQHFELSLVDIWETQHIPYNDGVIKMRGYNSEGLAWMGGETWEWDAGLETLGNQLITSNVPGRQTRVVPSWEE